MEDRFAFGKAVRIVRCGQSSEGVGIEGVLGMDMQVTEEGPAVGIWRGALEGQDLVVYLEDGDSLTTLCS